MDKMKTAIDTSVCVCVYGLTTNLDILYIFFHLLYFRDYQPLSFIPRLSHVDTERQNGKNVRASGRTEVEG